MAQTWTNARSLYNGLAPVYFYLIFCDVFALDDGVVALNGEHPKKKKRYAFLRTFFPMIFPFVREARRKRCKNISIYMPGKYPHENKHIGRREFVCRTFLDRYVFTLTTLYVWWMCVCVCVMSILCGCFTRCLSRLASRNIFSE